MLSPREVECSAVICSSLLTFVEHTILSEEPFGDDLGSGVRIRFKTRGERRSAVGEGRI
jgi:hypothetical protein